MQWGISFEYDFIFAKNLNVDFRGAQVSKIWVFRQFLQNWSVKVPSPNFVHDHIRQ